MDIITFFRHLFSRAATTQKGGEMTEKEKIRFIDYLRLRTRLRDASDGGAMLMLDGRPGSAETIASVCVFNDTGYYMNELRRGADGNPGVILVGLGHENG